MALSGLGVLAYVCMHWARMLRRLYVQRECSHRLRSVRIIQRNYRPPPPPPPPHPPQNPHTRIAHRLWLLPSLPMHQGDTRARTQRTAASSASSANGRRWTHGGSRSSLRARGRRHKLQRKLVQRAYARLLLNKAQLSLRIRVRRRLWVPAGIGAPAACSCAGEC